MVYGWLCIFLLICTILPKLRNEEDILPSDMELILGLSNDTLEVNHTSPIGNASVIEQTMLPSFDPEADKFLQALENKTESQSTEVSPTTPGQSLLLQLNSTNSEEIMIRNSANCEKLNGTHFVISVEIETEWSQDFLDNQSFVYTEFSKIFKEIMHFIFKNNNHFVSFDFQNFSESASKKVLIWFLLKFRDSDTHLSYLQKQLHNKSIAAFNIKNGSLTCELQELDCSKSCSKDDCVHHRCSDECCLKQGIVSEDSSANKTFSEGKSTFSQNENLFQNLSFLQNMILSMVSGGASKSAVDGLKSSMNIGVPYVQQGSDPASHLRPSRYRIYVPDAYSKRFKIPQLPQYRKHDKSHRHRKQKPHYKKYYSSSSKNSPEIQTYPAQMNGFGTIYKGLEPYASSTL